MHSAAHLLDIIYFCRERPSQTRVLKSHHSADGARPLGDEINDAFERILAKPKNWRARDTCCQGRDL